MNAAQVQTIFRDRLGLRIGPAVAAYVLRRIQSGDESPPMPPGAIPVIAADARIGAPVRQLIDLEQLAPLATPDS